MAHNTDAQWEIAVSEHEKIIAALKARNRRTLQSLLRAHLKHKRERVKELLAQPA
jgi:DNA-binding GntR family transcriptional regulator